MERYLFLLCQLILKLKIMKTLYVTLIAAVLFVSCKNNDSQGIVQDNKQATIDSMNVVIAKQKVIDSMNLEVEKAKAETKREVVVVNRTSGSNGTTTTTTTKRKGWSNTAKGAVLGAGVGAATGAIISKKKGQGAIIGGLAGAGIGAGTGAIIDGSKKNR